MKYLSVLLILLFSCSQDQKKVDQNQELVVDTTSVDTTLLEDYESIKAREANETKWTYQDETDKMTNTKTSFAMLQSDNNLTLSSPYDGLTTGNLTIRKKRNSLDVIMQITNGQIIAPSYDSKNVLIKFDDKPAKRWSYLESADYDSKVIFIRNEKSFVEKLKHSKKVIIEFIVYQDGNQQLEFSTQNLKF